MGVSSCGLDHPRIRVRAPRAHRRARGACGCLRCGRRDGSREARARPRRSRDRQDRARRLVHRVGASGAHPPRRLRAPPHTEPAWPVPRDRRRRGWRARARRVGWAAGIRAHGRTRARARVCAGRRSDRGHPLGGRSDT